MTISTNDIEWTPLFADHTPGYILGYTATIKGCSHVRINRADLRASGHNGIDWQVKLQDKWCEPEPFNAYGVASNFEQAKTTVAKVLDLAVSMGWIPEYRVQA